MKQYQLIDEQQRFAGPFFQGVMTLDDHEKMNGLQSEMTERERAVWHATSSLLSKLRKDISFIFFNTRTGHSHPGIQKTGTPCFGWIAPSQFKRKSGTGNTIFPSDSPDELGWTAARALAHHPGLKECQTLCEKFDTILNTDALWGAKSILSRLKNWQFVAEDPIEKLSVMNAFVIFNGTTNQYWSERHEWGALGNAKLFETEGVAMSIVSKTPNAVVVGVTTQVTALAPNQDLSQKSIGRLNEVLTRLESEQLKKTLTEDGMRPLRQRKARL